MDDFLAFMTFPKKHWRQISSTNPLERIDKEIKRWTNVVGIFPNDGAITRLVGALVNEQSDEWQVTRKYISKESLQKALNPVPEQPRLPAEGTDRVA
jgi:transposase-like protein